MSNLPGLVVDVEARIDKLEKALKRANAAQARSANQMEQRAKQSADRLRATYGAAGDGIAASFGKLPKALAGGLLAGVATAGIKGTVDQINQMVTSVAQVGDEAERAGVSVERFQELKFVADQNRISVDALVDGLKELNLRADEFVVTGKGSAAEAFSRLGFTASDLARSLKDPSELMLEIVGRLEGMDRAAQIRIADEIFGGTGGEQFVQLLDEGEAGIRATIDRAHELGIVMDAELIAKAAELDRRFNEIKATTASWLKGFVVGLADAGLELTDLRASLDRLFPSEDQGRAVLGDELYDGLAADRDAVDAQAVEIAQLREQFTGLGEDAIRTAASLEQAAALMGSYGYDQASAELADAAAEMRRLSDEFADGEIEAEVFAEGLDGVQRSASAAFDQLEDADRVDFSVAISEIGRLGSAIVSAIGLANALRTAIRDAANVTPASTQLQTFREADAESVRNAEAMAETQRNFLAAEEERNAKTSERLELERETAEVQERAAEAGAFLTNQQAEAAAAAAIAADEARRLADRAGRGGGGGGSKPRSSGGSASREPKLDEFERGVERIAEETKMLEIERLALISAAAAGEDLGRAVDLARQRAELLQAATKAGREDTPALRAEIDGLVKGYGTAAQAVDDVTEAQRLAQAARDEFTSTAEGAFNGLVTGALTFKEALAQVLMQLATMASSKIFKSIISSPGGESATDSILGLMGFASGGYTGHGGKYEPAGIVHRGEFVMSKRAVQRIGVDTLEGLHSRALRGYSSGGFVGPARPALASAGRSQAAPAIQISAPVTVNANGGTPEQNAHLAQQTARAMEQSLRNLMRDEMLKQQRPGGQLHRR